MKENQILVVIKEVGKDPYVEPLFDNTLEAFQSAVGGYIETVTFATDACLIVNEEGIYKGLPLNIHTLGCDLFGTVIAVGIKGDEFSSLKSSSVPLVMEMMRGGKG